jgi:hypothetical protein
MSITKSLGVVAFALALPACNPGPPIARSPDLARAPAASADDETSRRAAAEETARRDLGCRDVAVVAVLDRRYANSTSARYVIEGCAKRSLYVEDCADLPACRYLLVSLVPTASGPSPKGP